MEENQHLLIVLVFAFLFAAFDVLVREGLKNFNTSLIDYLFLDALASLKAMLKIK